MGNGVHCLDGLIASVGGSDISSHWYTAWKLERSLLLWIWQPRSHELLDESGYPHPEQLAPPPAPFTADLLAQAVKAAAAQAGPSLLGARAANPP
jgi:hypothetical protein